MPVSSLVMLSQMQIQLRVQLQLQLQLEYNAIFVARKQEDIRQLLEKIRTKDSD